VWQASLSADLVRSESLLERRDSAILRLSGSASRSTTLSAELQHTRVNDKPEWAAYVYIRTELDAQRWVGGTARAGNGSSYGFDIETGKLVTQGEGVGYRVGTSTDSAPGAKSGLAYGALNLNLRPATIELFGSSATRGGNSHYAEVAVSGAVVGVDGSWGLTRQVTDSFALARLGVPQPGVEVLLNNQVQGVTDAQGELFIPNVGAFGRQDVSINDKQLGMQYNLRDRRQTIAPAYRSGTLVDFGGKKLSAVAGMAWQVDGGRRVPVGARAWTMQGKDGALRIETGREGDFYLEEASAGDYTGKLQVGQRTYTCRVTIPSFAEAVMELKEGIVCE
jgi:outer membrane usher protein FimD/PapC